MAEAEVTQVHFIVAVSVLGGVSLFLLCLIIILYILLVRKIRRLEPNLFTDFKIQRPKLIHQDHNTKKDDALVKPDYVNHAFINSTNQQSTTDLNPIANRTKTSFDNGNFIFGSPNNSSLHSFRNPDYVDRNSRFY